jgi:hypothetical protein
MYTGLRNRGTPFFIRAGLLFSLGLLVCVLILYVRGIDYTDRTLFLLLTLLRCFSLLLCFFSLAALGFAIYNFARRPDENNAPRFLHGRLRHILFAFLYLLIAALGAVLVAANSFIVAFAGGNG